MKKKDNGSKKNLKRNLIEMSKLNDNEMALILQLSMRAASAHRQL